MKGICPICYFEKLLYECTNKCGNWYCMDCFNNRMCVDCFINANPNELLKI